MVAPIRDGKPPSDAPSSVRARRLALLVGAPVLCSLLLFGDYAWHQFQLAERQSQLAATRLAETAGRVREILITEQGLTESVMEPLANMTYDEFFRACDRSIDERKKLEIAVRLLPPNTLDSLRERIIAHFKATEELVRAKANLMHIIVRWQSRTEDNSDLARWEGEFLRTHVGGDREALKWAYKKSVAEIGAMANEMRDSADQFDGLYGKCVEGEQSLSIETRRAGITVVETVLKKFEKENKILSASARSAAK